MKQYLLVLSLLFFAFCVKAEKQEEVEPGYQVISDEFDDEIEAGFYIVEGKIQMATNGKIVKNVSIEIQNGKTVVSKNGYFELKIPITSYYVVFSNKAISDAYYENHQVKEKRRIKVIMHAAKFHARVIQREEKPVIYAYNEQSLNFTLKLKVSGELTFTYPQLPANNTWEMQTMSNGNLKNKNGIEFPYLFWEAENESGFKYEKNQGAIAGQVVHKKEVQNFLDSCLTVLNFNPKEKTDFITYWGPRLVQKEYALIQFQVNDQCSRFAEYEVKPQPDYFNRLYLLFTHLEEKPEHLKTRKQDLKTFSRDGFVVLEWGGIELAKELIYPLN